MIKASRLRRLRIGLSGIILRDPLGMPEPEPAIRQVIERLGHLSRLEHLALFGVLLGELPAEIRSLKRLRTLLVLARVSRNFPIGYQNCAT